MFRKLNSSVVKLHKNGIYCAYRLSSHGIKEQKIKIDKWDINYLKAGRGPHNVLCLPGSLGTIWTDFKHQIEGFDKDKFTVIVWDPPGYGKSRPPDKEFSKFSFEKEADYAAEFMKALHIPIYSVVGWSYGGIVSLVLAAKYPDAVVKLVTISALSYMLPHELGWYKNVRDLSSWSENNRRRFEEIYGKDLLPQYWAKWIDTMIAVYKKDNGNVASQYLKDIKCPTFIVHGEKDPLVDLSHTSYLLKHIARSKLHLYPEGKHNVHIKYADDFNKRVQEFLLLPSKPNI